MTARKERLTVTVDPAVVRAGQRAIAAGHADSLSAWVNLALTERAAKEQRLRALADAIALYERAHGRITPEELAAQARADRRAARVVRGPVSRTGKARTRRRGAA
ncbi:MAG TPA: hypothetical protein VGM29_15290 [Polyangiaceae bacterium]|jgi:glycerol dehydrogenase-like iron-containing ADH family enzyme